MHLIFSWGVVHIPDFDFLSKWLGSGHKLSATLKKNMPFQFNGYSMVSLEHGISLKDIVK